MTTPEIETDRLRLVRYRASMVTDQHVAWLNDPEVVKFSEQRHCAHTLETQHDYLNTFPKDSHIWLIKEQINGAIYHIGTITAYVDIHNKVANMGILIGQKGVWGKGYGTEAWTAVMGWLFESGIFKVEAGFMQTNFGMRKIVNRSRMELEAVVFQHFERMGKREDKILFGKFAP